MSRTATARAPLLGVSVVDALRGAPMTDLRAWAWDARLDAEVARGRELARVRAASPGLGGVLAWHDLPSYAGWSWRADPRATPEPGNDSQPGNYRRREHTIVVVDPAGRLHPIRATQVLPGPLTVGGEHEGLLGPLNLRAYPTATHEPPDGVVVVRAVLWDIQRDVAAAWALLRVTVDGRSATGLAGEDGQVAVFTPVPRLRAGVGVAAQSWPMAIEVRYAGLGQPLAGGVRHPITGLRVGLPTALEIEGQPVALLQTPAATSFVPPALPAGGEMFLAAPQVPAVPHRNRETRLFVTPKN